MAAIKAAVFTASIQNQDGVEEWMSGIQKLAREAQEALDGLREALRDAPHISIQLNRSEDD